MRIIFLFVLGLQFGCTTMSTLEQKQDTEIYKLRQELADERMKRAAIIVEDSEFTVSVETGPVKLRLVRLGHIVGNEELKRHLATHDLQPARIEHLIAFGTKYSSFWSAHSDRERKFWVIANGTSFNCYDEISSCVPILFWQEKPQDKPTPSSHLELRWINPLSGWDGDDYHFLAVSK